MRRPRVPLAARAALACRSPHAPLSLARPVPRAATRERPRASASLMGSAPVRRHHRRSACAPARIRLAVRAASPLPLSAATRAPARIRLAVRAASPLPLSATRAPGRISVADRRPASAIEPRALTEDNVDGALPSKRYGSSDSGRPAPSSGCGGRGRLRQMRRDRLSVRAITLGGLEAAATRASLHPGSQERCGEARSRGVVGCRSRYEPCTERVCPR